VSVAPKLITACIDGNEEGLEPGEKPVVLIPWRLSFVSIPAVNPVESLVLQEIEDAVRSVLLELTPFQKRVIEQRFGIGVDDEYTLEEIGQKVGLTRERIRQIEARALGRLRNVTRMRMLSAYYEASEWRLSAWKRPLRLSSYKAP
jgi:RNA polymerase primary sigma factor